MENRHLTVEEEDESLYSGYNDYNATFDSEVLATMCGSQNSSEQDPDDPTPELHPDFSGADDGSPAATNSVQENVAHLPLTLPLSKLHISEDVEDQEPLPEEAGEEEEGEEEEDEFVVLDSEHPLVREQQAALNRQLRKHLERLDLELKEKLAREKEDEAELEVLGIKMFEVQEELARLQTRLEDCDRSKAQAKAERLQVQDQLEAVRRQHSSMSSQLEKAKTNVSQLEAELDHLNLQLVYTQRVDEDLSSNFKTTKNSGRKSGAEKNKAEEQKLKQDLYVERLTKDLERLTQQIATYDAQIEAQAEETRAAKQALSEAETQLESVVMLRKHLLQQWSCSLMSMRSRDETFSAMQEAVRTTEHQVILLDREIEGYKKSISEEQERNETLTMQLKLAHMDMDTSKKLISQMQAEEEALQAEYSTCLRTLRETELARTRLSKEYSTLRAELNDQRKQLEKQNAMKLEMENKIMSLIQQKPTPNQFAQRFQQLNRLDTLRNKKKSQLWKLKRDIKAVGLECSEMSNQLDRMSLIQEDLDEQIAARKKLVRSTETKISSFVTLIGQKQTTIDNYNKKIYLITASTGHEDLSPLQIKEEAITAELEEVTAKIKSDQQLWMRRQGTLLELTQKLEANSDDILKLQTEYTALQQRKIYLDSQIEVEHREEMELDKEMKMRRRDLLKLNTLLSDNGKLSEKLEQENALMETEFLHRLKEAERESLEMQMQLEKTQDKKEKLLNSLLEAERQIMLWEKKTQLVKETRSVVGQEEQQMMKAEIHRMELRLNKLTKQQKQMKRESLAAVARFESVLMRREAMRHSSHRKATKDVSQIHKHSMLRKIKDTRRQVSECEQVIRELQESQVSVSDRLAQQKQRLIELHDTSNVLDRDLENLQDTKDRNLAHLVALQSRAKKLQAACEGRYRALTDSESVGAAQQRQMERVHTVNAILHRVCEEFPQYQGALRKPLKALAAGIQDLEQEKSDVDLTTFHSTWRDQTATRNGGMCAQALEHGKTDS